MRVLLLTEFHPSGQSTHVLDLAKQLVQLDHQVQIVFTSIHYPGFAESYGLWLQHEGIHYEHSIHIRHLMRMMKTFQPQLIHCHSSTILHTAQTLSQKGSCPYVVTCHGLGFSAKKYRHGLQGAARIIAVGPKTAQELLPLYADKLHIIPNGADVRRFRPGRKQSPVSVVYVGRIDASKETAIRALRDALLDVSGRELAVVGKWRSPLEGIAFQPWQPDLTALLSSQNILAGSGRTAREGLAAGCAVLLMNKGYDGLITPKLIKQPGFDFSGNQHRFPLSKLRGDLHQLVANTRRLVKLQSFGRRYARRYASSEAAARQTVEVYEQAVLDYQTCTLEKSRVSVGSRFQGWALNTGKQPLF